MYDINTTKIDDNNVSFRVYEFSMLLMFVLPVFVIYFMKLNMGGLYAHIIFGHAAALAVAIVRVVRKKRGKQIDVEIALAFTVTDLFTRFFLPYEIHLINNIIIFSMVLLFLYRQTKLSFVKHKIFLIGYGLSYFGLNYKLLDFSKEGFLGITYSVVLSVYFAYTLLAAGRVKNLYRATFCAGMALLTLIVLGKRVYVELYNPVVIIQAADTCLLAYCFIHWNNGRKEAHAVFGKTFFNISILPNTILFLSVMSYSFFTSYVSPEYAIYGLVIVVFIWYMISAIKGFMPLFKKGYKTYQVPLLKEIRYSLMNVGFLKKYLLSITT